MRFGDERTFSFCFDGVEEHKTVAVGTCGCIKRKEDKIFFKIGLARMMQKLSKMADRAVDAASVADKAADIGKLSKKQWNSNKKQKEWLDNEHWKD